MEGVRCVQNTEPICPKLVTLFGQYAYADDVNVLGEAYIR